jgi:AcrR family transcriptional regulator
MARAAFARIPREKQRLVLDAAMHEFASNGYHRTNINTVASKAGISIGALYKYFSSKEELFLETLRAGMGLIEDVYSRAMEAGTDPFERIRAVFLGVLCQSRENPHALRLYLSLLSPDTDEIASRYARTIEEVGCASLKAIVNQGIASGAIRPGIDVNTAVLFLDNHLMMFAFSQISRYLRIRQETFLGGGMDPERFMEETMRVCRTMFAPGCDAAPLTEAPQRL